MVGKILIQGSIVRALYGLLALFAPELLVKAIPGVELEEDARYLNRLFGGRDLLVTIGTVSAVRSGAHSSAVMANVFCEITDSVSLAEEVRVRGKLDPVTIVGLLFNVFGYATWLRAARALKAPSANSAESS
jgi:hypothetical protein